MAMSSAASRISCSLKPQKHKSTQTCSKTHTRTQVQCRYKAQGNADVLLVRCSPFVVLLRGQRPCLYELLQQQAHVLSGDGAALQR